MPPRRPRRPAWPGPPLRVDCSRNRLRSAINTPARRPTRAAPKQTAPTPAPAAAPPPPRPAGGQGQEDRPSIGADPGAAETAAGQRYPAVSRLIPHPAADPIAAPPPATRGDVGGTVGRVSSHMVSSFTFIRNNPTTPGMFWANLPSLKLLDR